ncbi:hypothetical protein ACQ4LE_000614 [Meloidogyne hapla]
MYLFFYFFLLFFKNFTSNGKILFKVEWRPYKSEIPEIHYSKLESVSITEHYDVCTFNNDYLYNKLPFEQQNNVKYYMNVYTSYGEQLVLNYLINGFNQIITIKLKSTLEIEAKSFTNNDAKEIERPMRILKFIINKFEQKLKFTIGCKMQKIRSKFEIKEFNDHYESFYDQKHKFHLIVKRQLMKADMKINI